MQPATGLRALSLVPDDLTKTGLAPSVVVTSPDQSWQNLQLMAPMPRRHFLSGMPLVDFFRSDPAARAVDMLRTRVLQTLRRNGWNRIAVAAPTQGCGATFTAVNLALSLARIPDSRNILIDMNHRSPGVARALDLAATGDMRGFLCGQVPMQRHLVRMSETLALGLTAGSGRDSAELLHDARCADTLNRMTATLCPDVVLYDLPSVLEHDDLSAFLPQVDGVLLVTDGTRTQASQIAECHRVLEAHTRVLGVVLNRARQSGLDNRDA